MKVSGRDQNGKVMFGSVEVIVFFVITNQPKNMFHDTPEFFLTVSPAPPPYHDTTPVKKVLLNKFQD